MCHIGIEILAEPQQRQDSLDEQLRDLAALADRAGMYDAADWIRDQLNGR